MQIICLISNIVPQKTIPNYLIELTLQNSATHNKKQKPLIEYENEGNTFYKLGLLKIVPKYKSVTNWSNIDKFIALDEQVRSYNSLETLINQLGISEFATLKYKDDKMIYQSNINFDYARLRDMQNMDWAEESVKYGQVMRERGEKPEAVLKYYESALELDALNKAAHILRGDTLVELNRIEDAIEAYKIALKLDTKDKELQKKIEKLLEIMEIEEQKKSKAEPVILETEGQPKMILLQRGRKNNDYSMTFDETKILTKPKK